MTLTRAFYPWLLVATVAFAAARTASAQTAAPSTTPAASATPVASVAATTKPSPVSKQVLEKYDANHNGVIDPDEQKLLDKDRAAKRAERLSKYDKNHDGKLDDNERAAMKADREAERQKASASKATASPTP